jgi:hypothetical protein
MLMLNELHANVPEVDRPLSFSDLSDEQAERAGNAVRVVTTAMREEIERKGWQPIETAPKDGAVKLGFQDGVQFTFCWMVKEERWCVRSNGLWARNPNGEFSLVDPTHWQPLPDLPALTTDHKGAAS